MGQKYEYSKVNIIIFCERKLTDVIWQVFPRQEMSLLWLDSLLGKIKIHYIPRTQILACDWNTLLYNFSSTIKKYLRGGEQRQHSS